jgi:magnesium chelatase accessory protein
MTVHLGAAHLRAISGPGIRSLCSIDAGPARCVGGGVRSAVSAADSTARNTTVSNLVSPVVSSAVTSSAGATGSANPSTYVHSGGIRWNVMAQGQGPRVLLLHGTGSAGNSWNRLVAALAGRFETLAPDLPGHGWSGALAPGRSGLDAYAGAVATLVTDMGAWPDIIVGHSAGAAIAARIALESRADRVAVISINGALRPLHGWAAASFVPLARLLGGKPLVPNLVAFLVRADTRAVRRLLDSTGSRIDAEMLARYEQLMQRPEHIAGTLRMLAHWDLRVLVEQLHRLGPRLTLVTGSADRTVAPQDADWVQARVAGSALIGLPALGHLAHEEAPERIAQIVVSVARERGLLDDAPLPAEMGA